MQKYIIKKDQKKTILIGKSGKYFIDLVGQGAEVEILGSFLAQNDDFIDVEVTVHHKAKNTLANTTLRGVARDQSRIRLFGRIVINEGCGLSNSFLTERVLLLSNQASAEAVPELEILTDDVKCSHAASVSEIPSEQLFYLMSRGIQKKQAEDLIIQGFLKI
ncbi:MAG: SufD family Fe-S cluster assembly protein [Pseudomonadales bacterium]|nr:SufD family Fe-S cluster assembly protein [Pseudomonadales bacterium]